MFTTVMYISDFFGTFFCDKGVNDTLLVFTWQKGGEEKQDKGGNRGEGKRRGGSWR